MAICPNAYVNFLYENFFVRFIHTQWPTPAQLICGFVREFPVYADAVSPGSFERYTKTRAVCDV
jgi:hypothetical protein